MKKQILSLLGLCALCLLQACDSSNNSDSGEISSSSVQSENSSSSQGAGSVTSSSSSAIPVEVKYLTDTAAVDYKGLNQVVYYDFSSGKKTVIAHDTWHLAFDADLNLVANGGNYGFGVAACSTGIADFSADFSSWKDSTSRYTRTDTNANVWGKSYVQAGVLTHQVYLAKLESGAIYKFQVTGVLNGNSGLKLKIGALDAPSAEEVEFKYAEGYGHTFIDIVNLQAVLVEPLLKEWDIRFGRTEYQMGSGTSGRSTIGVNSQGGVAAASIVTENDIELSSVMEMPAASSFSATPLAIGSSWVVYSPTTKLFTMQPVVYVVKTTEGYYAKMRLLNFMGPNNEYYYSLFKYLYQADGATRFAK